MNWEVGQEVTIIEVDRRREGVQWAAMVTKVGRKYVTVERLTGWPATAQYNIDSGYEHSAGGFMPRTRIVTPRILAAEQRRAGAIEAMKALGWKHDGWGKPTMPTETIEAMVAAAHEVTS